MSKNSFTWAQATNANVIEPIRELAENGWQHRDIPKASNMNWIFKQISEDLDALRKELAALKEGVSSELTLLKENTASEFVAVRADEALIKRRLKATMEIAVNSKVACGFNHSISGKICMQLKNLVANIRAHHPGIPEIIWPLRDEGGARTEDEEVKIE